MFSRIYVYVSSLLIEALTGLNNLLRYVNKVVEVGEITCLKVK